MHKNNPAFRVAMLGVLAALNVIAAELLKFPVIPKVLELNFGFVPLAVAGMLFGPVEATLVGIVGDIVGASIRAYLNAINKIVHEENLLK